MKYLFLSLFILALSFFNLARPVEDAGALLVSPLQSAARAIAIELKEYIFFVSNITDIYSENQILKRKILDLRTKTVSMADLEEEVAVLRQQLGVVSGDETTQDSATESDRASFAGRKLLLVNMTGNFADLTKTTVHIDAGTHSGVAEGMQIIYKNILVGMVVEVGKYRSLVELVYSPNVVIAVKNIDVPERTEGIVSGDYGTMLRLDRVLQKEAINIGDTLVTSGKDGYFDPGLIVGKVIEIDDVPTEPLKSALVAPFIEVENLNKVFVLLD